MSFVLKPAKRFTSRAALRAVRAASVLGAGAALSLPALPAAAGPVNAYYAVSLAGIPIGVATLTGEVDPGGYKVEVSAKLTGLASVVSDGKGAAKASGVVADGRVLAGGYALTASNSHMTRTIQIGMQSGNISAVRVVPPFEEKDDRIPVTDANKRGVVDPVSALMMPMLASGPLNPANCNRTIPVFDGSQRFNVVLTYSGTRTVHDRGMRGPVLVCHARYVPVAGHRPNRPATKFMENNHDMEAWLAPVAGTHILVPYRIAVRTMIGTAVIAAQRVEGVTASLGE